MKLIHPNKVVSGTVDHKLSLAERKTIIFNTFYALGIYPGIEVIMAKGNLSQVSAEKVRKTLRAHGCKYNKQLNEVLYKHLKENA